MIKDYIIGNLRMLLLLSNIVFMATSCKDKTSSHKIDYDDNGVVIYCDDSLNYAVVSYLGEKGESYDGWGIYRDSIEVQHRSDQIKLEKADNVLVIVVDSGQRTLSISDEQFAILWHLGKPYPSSPDRLLTKIEAEQVAASDR